MAEGEPPAKRHHRCSNRSDFLEEEEWSDPVECSTPVWQLDGRSSEFDSEEELEGSFLNGDANGIVSCVKDGGDAQRIASEVGLDYLGLNEESIESFILEVESEEPSLNWLPCEVLEVVFCHLPLVELFTSCRLVCRKWNDVIMREKYLRWKKRYHMVKSGRCLPVSAAVSELLFEHDMVDAPYMYFSSHTSCLINVAIFVGKEFENVTVEQGMEEKLMRVLIAHPQYSCVERIAELHPWLNEGEKTLGAIQALSLLVVCCHSVDQVFSLLISLLTPEVKEGGGGGSFGTPLCSRITVVEIFYCLACLCYALWNRGVLPQRFHYFIYYSLNVLERGLSPTSPSQPSSPGQWRRQPSIDCSLQLTSEQCKIVNHPLKPGETVQVKAFAGTGKTTTLRCLTALNPDWRFLYCVYNKSVQQHAKSNVFPRTVTCKTFHSLAWEVGGQYESKFQFSFTPYKVSQWVNDVPQLGEAGPRLKSRYIFSKYVYAALLKFIASDSPELTEQHLKIDAFDADCADLHEVTGYYASAVLREAKRIWREMTNLKNKKIGMTHDGYLKLYQLQNPQITEYDCILVDEAQDLTPAIISIIKAQKCAKVLVGDPHQQIYGFKGATDAMALIHADHTFHLTRSFRFGPEIAYTASCILEVLKGVKRQTIVGGLQPDSIQGEQSGQLAIIARCNDTLFVEMARAVESGNRPRLGFAGGLDSYNFDMLLDIHKLLQGRKDVSHPLIKKFLKDRQPYKSLRTYAENSNDIVLLKKIKICERFSRNLPTIISQIREMACKDNSFADIVFSTAHKSKGLEFDTVKLTNDYLESYDHRGNSHPYSSLPPDERNLLYVAVTRAKKQLIVTPTLLDVLHRAKEFFVYPSGCQETQLSEVVCAVCSLELPPPRLSLERRKIQLANNSKQHRGGLVCKTCSYTVLPCFGACF